MSSAADSDLTSAPSNLGAYKWAAVSALGLALLLACYWMPVLSGSASFFVSDHSYYFEPFARFIGDAFRHGRLPLWNPYLYCGMSQIAVPSPGVFYPANLLFAVLNYSQSVALQMLFHQVLAGFGTFLLVSSFGWGLVPAAVASLIMALTGYMFSLTTNCTLAFSACFLPISLWVFRSIAVACYEERFNCRCWLMVLAAVSVFGLIAAGRPEVFAPSSLLIVIYCLVEGLQNKRGGKSGHQVFAAWIWQLIAFSMGLAIAMPVLLPVAEWAAISPRAKGFVLSTVFMWSTNWYDLVGMLCPQPFGNLLILGNKYLPLVSTRTSFYPYVPSLFIGPVAFSLSIWGFFDRSWAWRKWLLLALVVFLIICLGENTPLAPYAVKNIRSLSVLRYPVKMMIFPIVFLAVAAARGTKVLLAKEIGHGARVFCLGFWLLAFIWGIVYLVMGLAEVVMPWKRAIPPFAEVSLGVSVIGTVLIGFTCCAAEYIYSKGKLAFQTISYVVIAGLALNLSAVAFCNKQMTTVGNYFEHEQTLAKWLSELEINGKPEGRFLNLAFDPVQLPEHYQFARDASVTADFFAYGRDVFICNTSIDSKRGNAFGYEAAETGVYRSMALYAVRASMIDAKPEELKNVLQKDKRLIDLPLVRLCQSTGTRWVGSQIFKPGYYLRVLNPLYFDVAREDIKANYRIYKVKGATPRSYFSEYWRWIDDSKVNNIFRFAPLSVPLIERNSAKPVPPSINGLAPELPRPPADAPKLPTTLAGEVLIDRLDRLSNPDGSSNARESEESREPRESKESKNSKNSRNSKNSKISVQAPDSSVTVMMDEPEHISISVANKRPGFLILCDHFYPGWSAFVDSIQVPLYKANMEMRAVYLPAGTHLVQYEFQSESLGQGLIIAGCGLFLLLCFLIAAVWPSVWRFVKSTAGQ